LAKSDLGGRESAVAIGAVCRIQYHDLVCTLEGARGTG
jgi:hypothetical protein